MSSRLVFVFASLVAVSAFAQSPASSQPGAISERQQMFDQAKQEFAAEHWSTAFSDFSALHDQFPEDNKISEFLAESALNIGNTQLAISLMEPILKASPASWLASVLLVRAYAQSNRDADRDAEIANLKHLHDVESASKIAQKNPILLERRILPNGSVRIWYGLEPWGKGNMYLFARIYDAQGTETYHVVLDSLDTDQALWAKAHPKEAAAGERVFYLDGYTPLHRNPDGRSSYTQALLGVFDGQPTYDLIRDRILAIAAAHTTSPAATPHISN